MNYPTHNPPLKDKQRLNHFVNSKVLNRIAGVRGFTLIEVFIVIAIIGTLSAISIPIYLKYKYNAEVVVAITDIRLIEKEISFYIADNDQLPDSLNNLPVGTKNDPWGNPYQYLKIAGGSVKGKGLVRKNMMDVPVNQDYDLYSVGKDGNSQATFKANASRDDVVRAYEGRYVGLVSEL